MRPTEGPHFEVACRFSGHRHPRPRDTPSSSRAGRRDRGHVSLRPDGITPRPTRIRRHAIQARPRHAESRLHTSGVPASLKAARCLRTHGHGDRALRWMRFSIVVSLTLLATLGAHNSEIEISHRHRPDLETFPAPFVFLFASWMSVLHREMPSDLHREAASHVPREVGRAPSGW